MYTSSPWELPPELEEKRAAEALPKWYREPNAAENITTRLSAEWQAIQAADPAPWNPSPLKTEIGIQTGRVLNLAFITTCVLAAPASVAFSPFVTTACFVLAAACGAYHYCIKDEKQIQAMLGTSELAPPAVHALSQQAFARVGLPTDNFNTVILHPDQNAKSLLLRQLPYTAAATNRTKTPTIMIGKRVLDTLTQDELFAVICHEASHIKNDKVPTRSPVEKIAISLPLMFTAASVCTLSFTGAGYYYCVLLAATLAGKYLKRIDEYRADSNSVGLARNPVATLSGYEKIMDTLLGEFLKLSPEKIEKVKKRSDALELFNEHPASHKRASHVRSVAKSLNI